MSVASFLRVRRWRALFLAASVAFAAAGLPAAAPRTLARYEASRLSMACVYAIVAYGDDALALPRILEEALDEVDRIDRLMSHYKPESPLSRLNRDAARGAVAIDPELFDFIALALRHGRDSGGAFDITVGPLMKAWGFFRGEGRVPDDRELAAIRRRVGYHHVVLDPDARTVRFDAEGVELDLGGIAKGYAVDRVIGLLKRRGVAAALVSAGGSTVYGLGSPPGFESWDVKVQDPVDPAKIAFAAHLRDQALSVAGQSEKSFEADGVLYSHIMDPQTGKPVQGVLSVAVVAKTGTDGDALDDALFVMGVEKSRTYLKRYPRTEAYFMLPDRHHRWRTVRVKN
jgi:thiamine biosynthesis lipoprotein